MLSPGAKVGLMVILAGIALVAVYYFLTGAGLKAQSYDIHVVFQDAKGLERGAPVRLAGVRIGQVERVEVTQDGGRNLASAKLLINRKFRLGRNFVYTIGTVGLIGQPYIEIIPSHRLENPLRPGATVHGKEAVDLTDLLPRAQMLLTNLNKAALAANKMLTDRELIEGFRNTAKNLESTSAKADKLVSTFLVITNENRNKLTETLDSAAEATRSLKKMATDIAGLLDDPKWHEEVKETLANVRVASEHLANVATKAEAIADNMTAATSNMDSITTDVKGITGDEQFTSDLKEAVANAKDASAEAKDMLMRLNAATQKFKMPDIKLDLGVNKLVSFPRLDLLGGTTEGELRADLNFFVPRKDGDSWLWGVWNLGESNKINLQYDSKLSELMYVRYGMWASKLGLGIDFTPSDRYTLEMDLYGTNHPRFDVYNRFLLVKNFGLSLGMEGVGRQNRLFGGLMYKK